MKWKWSSFSKAGKSKEVELSKLLLKECGGEVRPATEREDMYRHIDLFWKKDGKEYGIDVKGARKKNRWDSEPNYEINWIELKNVQGKKGWLFGDMDFVAFEHKEFWFFVKPSDIKKLLDDKMTGKEEIKDTKEIYTYYRRKDRLDLIVMVPNEDLVKIAVKIINKNKDE